MKKLSFIALIAGTMVLGMTSCNKEEKKGSDEQFAIEYKQDMDVVMAGTPVKFTDLSLGAASRTWTFQDGTPASSKDAEVSVVFASYGSKNCSLDVTFSDGSSLKKDFTIMVNEELSAEIAVSGLSEMGCAKFGSEITFSIENSKGGADSYEWTFPGGTPATSTEASPKVVWNSQINDVEVKCVVKRSSDNAAITLTENIIAGNYPLFLPDDVFEKDMFSFDKYNALGSAHVWADCGSGVVERNDCDTNPGLFSYVQPGANGTAQGLKLNFPVNNDIMSALANAYEFNFRDNWSNNAIVTIGQKLELKMSFKVADATTLASVSWGLIANDVETWLWDNARGIKPEDSWSDVHPDIDYESALALGNLPFGQFAIATEENPEMFTTEWKEYTWIFDTSVADFAQYKGLVLPNTYITFGIIATGPVCIDEIQLNVIED